jgi:hypothetical protein
MDRNHTLEAPNNDELSTIEQIEDRSDLSGIYRAPGEQFQGEILSEEERTKVKAEELEAITSGIGRSALSVGLLVIYPFVSGALIAVGLYELAVMAYPMVLVSAAILSIGIWMLTSYKAYASIYKLFYKHALRAGPFLVVALVSLIMASQAIYGTVVDNFSVQSAVFNVSLISLLLVMYSLIISYILLGIWGNSKLKSGVKALVSGLIIIVSGFFVLATYLF